MQRSQYRIDEKSQIVVVDIDSYPRAVKVVVHSLPERSPSLDIIVMTFVIVVAKNNYDIFLFFFVDNHLLRKSDYQSYLMRGSKSLKNLATCF